METVYTDLRKGEARYKGKPVRIGDVITVSALALGHEGTVGDLATKMLTKKIVGIGVESGPLHETFMELEPVEEC